MFWVDKVLFKGWSVNTLLQVALSPLQKKQGELLIPSMQLVYKVPYYKCGKRIFYYAGLTCLFLRQMDLTAFELKCKSSKYIAPYTIISPGRTVSLVAASSLKKKIPNPQNDIECVVFLNALLQGDQEAFI